MSKILAAALDKSGAAADGLIAKLEGLSGYQSEDVRLLAQTEVEAKTKIASLGMDPSDTTSEEFHQALLAKFSKDNDQLSKIFKTSGNVDGHLNNAARLAREVMPAGSLWALKHRAAKDILKANQPKHLMKKLGYRSVDSMLKRESAASLYAALPFVESARWLKNFQKSITQLTAADFESRQVEVLTMPAAIWEEAVAQTAFVSRLPLLSAVVLWPKPLAVKISEPALSVAVLQAAEDLRAYSVFFKVHQMQAGFGQLLLNTLKNGLPEAASLAGQPLSWPQLHNHYSRDDFDHPEVLSPHVSAEDFNHSPPLQALSQINPLLKWWAGNDSLAHCESRTGSLHFSDVMLHYIHDLSHVQSTARNFYQSFWQELLSRYLAHPGVEKQLLDQLDSHLMPQTVDINVDDFDEIFKSDKSLQLA